MAGVLKDNDAGTPAVRQLSPGIAVTLVTIAIEWKANQVAKCNLAAYLLVEISEAQSNYLSVRALSSSR